MVATKRKVNDNIEALNDEPPTKKILIEVVNEYVWDPTPTLGRETFGNSGLEEAVEEYRMIRTHIQHCIDVAQDLRSKGLTIWGFVLNYLKEMEFEPSYIKEKVVGIVESWKEFNPIYNSPVTIELDF